MGVEVPQVLRGVVPGVGVENMARKRLEPYRTPRGVDAVAQRLLYAYVPFGYVYGSYRRASVDLQRRVER